MSKYSYGKTIKKGIKYAVIFILPFIVDIFIDRCSTIANLSIGTGLLLIVDFLKHKVGIRLIP